MIKKHIFNMSFTCLTLYFPFQPQVLSGGGIAFNDCGCQAGLTCTKVGRKKRWKNKRGKKRKRKRRYKYRCKPIPTETPEISEIHSFGT